MIHTRTYGLHFVTRGMCRLLQCCLSFQEDFFHLKHAAVASFRVATTYSIRVSNMVSYVQKFLILCLTVNWTRHDSLHHGATLIRHHTKMRHFFRFARNGRFERQIEFHSIITRVKKNSYQNCHWHFIRYSFDKSHHWSEFSEHSLLRLKNVHFQWEYVSNHVWVFFCWISSWYKTTFSKWTVHILIRWFDLHRYRFCFEIYNFRDEKKFKESSRKLVNKVTLSLIWLSTFNRIQAMKIG